MSDNHDPQKKARKRRAQFRKLVADNETYPLATLTYHGPDPFTASKISVGIIKSEEETPILRHWEGQDIAEDEEVALEITRYLQEQGVERVITSESVMSCPHEEGIDYPEGEECPYCEFWARETEDEKKEDTQL